MNTKNIDDVLYNDQLTAPIYKGCLPLDIAAKTIRSARPPFVLVFNTQPKGMPGEHWICVYAQERSYYYFDSYGRPPTHYPDISRSLRLRFKRAEHNTLRLQGHSTTVCGDYCVLFCLLISRGWSPRRIVHRLRQLPDFESRDHAVRDLLIHLFGVGVFHSMHPPDSTAYAGDDFVHVKSVLDTLL